MHTACTLRVAAPFLVLLLLAASPERTDSFGDRLTAAITKQLSWRPSTGAAVGVVRNGKLIYVRGFGLRDVARRKPVGATTRFEIGSVTKQFTAAAILQLKEQGKLALDDPLARYVPSFPHARDVTLRQLLNHVSGLADYTEVDGAETDMSSAPGSLAKIAAYARRPLRFKPGTRYEYSNTNYYVLGSVIEVASGRPYDDYVRARLFAPAGMAHSDFMRNESKLTDFATPYWHGTDMKGPVRPAPPFLESWAGGSGALVSTVGDLAAWDTALAGGKVVSVSDYRLMSTPASLSNGAISAYGMGLSVDEFDGHQRVWHSGGTNGSLALDATYPRDRVDVIVFENDVSGDPTAIEADVFEAMFPSGTGSAATAAKGEDVAVRPRVLHFIQETLHGTMPASEMSPEYAKIATPDTQKHVAARFAAFGAPKAFTFLGKGSRPAAMRYTYRVQFARRAFMFVVIIDNRTKLVDGLGVGRAQ